MEKELRNKEKPKRNFGTSPLQTTEREQRRSNEIERSPSAQKEFERNHPSKGSQNQSSLNESEARNWLSKRKLKSYGVQLSLKKKWATSVKRFDNRKFLISNKLLQLICPCHMMITTFKKGKFERIFEYNIQLIYSCWSLLKFKKICFPIFQVKIAQRWNISNMSYFPYFCIKTFFSRNIFSI